MWMVIIQFFFVRKDCSFDQFLARVCEVLQINSNKYSIMMKTTLRFCNTIYCTCSLLIDIFNDEMANVVLDRAYDVVNYRCILIFITTSLRVWNRDVKPLIETKTSFRANVFVLNITTNDVVVATLLFIPWQQRLHWWQWYYASRFWRRDVTINNIVRATLLFLPQQWFLQQ